MPRKTTRGRQKVAMQRMQNESNLQVTFSKRRTGIFKKASELCTLCGAELAIIVFSPGNKAFSFGHPNVDYIIDRFLTNSLPPPNPADHLMVVHRNANVRDLNMQLTHAQAMLEHERHRAAALDHARAVSRSQRRWEAPIVELRYEELVELRGAMENLRVNVRKQIEMLTQQQQENPPTFQPGSGVGGGGGSSFGGGTNVYSLPPAPTSFGGGGNGGAPVYFAGPSSSSGRGCNNFPSFSGGSSSFGVGVGGNGVPTYSVWPSTSLEGGGTLPHPPVPPGSFVISGSVTVSPFSTESISLAGGGTLPFSPWLGSTSGGLQFLGESSSSGYGGSGGAFSFPPTPISFGCGGALPFSSGSCSFGRSGGNGGVTGGLPYSPGPNSYGCAGGLPYSPGPNSYGCDGDSSGIGGLPYPPRPSSHGHVGHSNGDGVSGLPYPPGPSSYGGGIGVLPFPQGPVYIGRGGGGVALPMAPQPGTSYSGGGGGGGGPPPPVVRGSRGHRGYNRGRGFN